MTPRLPTEALSDLLDKAARLDRELGPDSDVEWALLEMATRPEPATARSRSAHPEGTVGDATAQRPAATNAVRTTGDVRVAPLVGAARPG